MANKNYVYEDDERAEKNYREFILYKGLYPIDGDFDWEDMHAMRKRMIAVLERYKRYPKVIVACHGMIIQSLCDGYHPQNGEIVEFAL